VHEIPADEPESRRQGKTPDPGRRMFTQAGVASKDQARHRKPAPLLS
jgi:hypothetical protein